MVRNSTLNGSRGSCEYRVEMPRASDAIGVVLRDAYDRDQGLPDDMAQMLRRLNGETTSRRN
ncbi:hypothetical protein [Sphingomonas sp.]|uniref:hypothetical protein n=1 Tax=Sphingomonas sp. TaxID=28214 RepID=UPI001EB23483|nr:hypothetical protein [Sphingomonas sp.]MBX3594320.1 hypothetical protein [Sphingomonas sp.]